MIRRYLEVRFQKPVLVMPSTKHKAAHSRLEANGCLGTEMEMAGGHANDI